MTKQNINIGNENLKADGQNDNTTNILQTVVNELGLFLKKHTVCSTPGLFVCLCGSLNR